MMMDVVDLGKNSDHGKKCVDRLLQIRVLVLSIL